MSSLTEELALFGGNRGGHAFLDALPRRFERTTIVDPEPGRALRLRERHRLVGDAIEAPAELVLAQTSPSAVRVAATDSPRANQAVWDAASEKLVFAQQVIRQPGQGGLPGGVIAMSAMRRGGDAEPEMSQVISDFAEIPRGHSTDFDDDSFSALEVRRSRRLVSEVTAQAAVEPRRRQDTATNHRLVYAGHEWPLTAVVGEIGSRETRALAEAEAARLKLTNATVFVRDASGVDLVVVRRGRAVGRFPIWRRPPPRAAPPAVRVLEPDLTETLVTD